MRSSKGDKPLQERIADLQRESEAQGVLNVELSRQNAELSRQLAEERARLDWLIHCLNETDHVEFFIENLFDNLPGDSGNLTAEVRSAIDIGRGETK